MTFFVLGDEDVILGFKFAGIGGVVINTAQQAMEEFNNVTSGKHGQIGVLLITEKVSTMIDDVVREWQISGEYPLLVEIPDLDGHLEGKKTMLESIREAIGLHV